jgi:hypothetical protein
MEQDAIYAFDTLYTNRQSRMLKLAIPLLPPVYGSFLAIYIKFSELQHTIKFVQKTGFSSSAGHHTDFHVDAQSMEQYFQSITPYLSPEDREMLQRIRRMLQTMEEFKQMKPILDIIAQTTESNASDDATMDILKNFLSEEQLSLFQLFRNQT